MKFRPISKLSMPRVKLPLSIQQIIKMFLAVTYTIVCAVIIIPQIDHQPWYPKALRTFDLVPGIEFSSFRRESADLSSFTLDEKQKDQLLSILWKRLASSDISDADMSLTGNILTIDLPESASSQFVSLLTSKGEIEILSPTNPDQFTENPLLAYDAANYSESGLSVSDITSADFTQEQESFSYITLGLKPEKIDTWNAFASEHSSSSFGLSIDGNMNQAWMIASSGTVAPTLVVYFTQQETELFTALLRRDPLPFAISTTSQTINHASTDNMFFQLYTLLAGTVFLSALMRQLLLKERLTSTMAVIFTIAGIIAIFKTTSIPVTSEIMLSLIMLSAFHLSLRTQLQLPFSVFVFISGIVLTLSSHIAMINVGHMLLISGVFGAISSFFYYFVNIYEEN